MKVKVRNFDKLMNLHAAWNKIPLYTEYSVLAIQKWHRKKQYLIIDENKIVEWWDDVFLEVIDESVPKNWVSVKYKNCHKFKNKKYDFSIPISFYQGPKAFLQNEDFFFDIYENSIEAYHFCSRVIHMNDELNYLINFAKYLLFDYEEQYAKKEYYARWNFP